MTIHIIDWSRPAMRLTGLGVKYGLPDHTTAGHSLASPWPTLYRTVPLWPHPVPSPPSLPGPTLYSDCTLSGPTPPHLLPAGPALYQACTVSGPAVASPHPLSGRTLALYPIWPHPGSLPSPAPPWLFTLRPRPVSSLAPTQPFTLSGPSPPPLRPPRPVQSGCTCIGLFVRLAADIEQRRQGLVARHDALAAVSNPHELLQRPYLHPAESDAHICNADTAAFSRCTTRRFFFTRPTRKRIPQFEFATYLKIFFFKKPVCVL